MLSIISCACWPSVCLPWRNVYLDLLSIFWLYCIVCLLLSCMSCLYIMEIKLLWIASFANIFSQSVGCLFILFMVSFAVQKFISLVRSHLFILHLFLLPWETDLRKHCYSLCQRMFCLCCLLGVLWCHVLYLSL